MTPLEQFVRDRLNEAERAAESRDTSKPIHETGCYYYNNQYDPAYCDCDGPIQALRSIRSQIEILNDITAEKHLVIDGDPYFTCRAATEERDGGESWTTEKWGTDCSCGRDARVERRLKIMARAWWEDPDYEPEWSTQ